MPIKKFSPDKCPLLTGDLDQPAKECSECTKLAKTIYDMLGGFGGLTSKQRQLFFEVDQTNINTVAEARYPAEHVTTPEECQERRGKIFEIASYMVASEIVDNSQKMNPENN